MSSIKTTTLGVLWAAGLALPALGQETLVVDLNGGGDFTEIQPAIVEAQDGETVLVKPGEYLVSQPITFEGKAITVKGEEGSGRTTVRMSANPTFPELASVVIFGHGETACSVLEGFTITGDVANQHAGQGGGIEVSGSSPTIIGCFIVGNEAEAGGGVVCSRSSPTFVNCVIADNLAETGGGVWVGPDASPTFINCTIAGNTTDGGGGVSVFRGNVTLTNCIVWNNEGGSVVLEGGGNARISYSCLEDQDWPGAGNISDDPLFLAVSFRLAADSPCRDAATSDGAPTTDIEGNGRPCGAGEDMGAYESGNCLAPPVDPAAEVQMNVIQAAIDAAADGDTVLIGPGEYVITGPLDFNRLHNRPDPNRPPVKNIRLRSEAGPETTVIRMAECAADPDRPLVIFQSGENESSVLEGFTLKGGRSTPSGGVSFLRASSPSLVRCTIIENERGVYCSNSSPTLLTCTITQNRGAAVYCEARSNPTLRECVLSENQEGVICSGSSPDLLNCTITGHGPNRGGVDCGDGSSPHLVNCTITGNHGHQGGGVRCGTESFPMLINCTIVGNSSGVVSDSDGSPSLTNCIVWGNAEGSIVAGPKSNPRVRYSLIGDGGWAGVGNVTGNPLFLRDGVFDFDRWNSASRLPQYTVVAGDYRLRRGSPAIDSGTFEGAPEEDAEGYERPCDDGIDMGSREFCFSREPLFQRGDANDDRRVNLADPIHIVSHLFGGGAALRCGEAADADDTGSVNITDVVYLLSFTFSGGPPPEAPFPDCDPDPTVDDLTCLASAGCQ